MNLSKCCNYSVKQIIEDAELKFICNGCNKECDLKERDE